MKPLIHLQTPDHFTMPRRLKRIVDTFALSGVYRWETAMAEAPVATIPRVVVFVLAQRYVFDGISATSGGGA